jgi:hypothetical protein
MKLASAVILKRHRFDRAIQRITVPKASTPPPNGRRGTK